MGPYLSVPKKEKHPTFGENAKVSLFLPKLSLLIFKNYRSSTEHAKCRVGETLWKTHI